MRNGEDNSLILATFNSYTNDEIWWELATNKCHWLCIPKIQTLRPKYVRRKTTPNISIPYSSKHDSEKHKHFSFLTQVREHNPPTPNGQYPFWWTLRLKGGIQFNEIMLYTILYNCFYTWYDTHDIIINIPYFKIAATLKSLLLVITSISWLVIFSPISNLANPLSEISIITKDLTWICWGAYV